MTKKTTYGVIRLDRVSATKDESLLRSVKYMGTGATPTMIENGDVVSLDGLASGEREVYVGKTPVATDTKIAIICSPELIYDESVTHDLYDFYNEEGKICRAFIPHKGDVFSVTKIDGITPTKGNLVYLQAGTRMMAGADAGTATVIGEIIDVETVGRLKYFVIEVM